MLTPIKTEASSEIVHPLYRFSPSPPPATRYQNFQGDGRHQQPNFEPGHRQSYSDPPSSAASSISYHSSSSTPAMIYSNPTNNTHDTYDGNGYPVNGCEGEGMYTEHYSPSSSPPQDFCPCRTNPAYGPAFMALSQQLQGTLDALRQYNHHPSTSQCLIFRRIAELNNLMHGTIASDAGGQSYDELSTPTDSEILTPLSATSSHTSFHGSPEGPSPQEWHTLSAAGYNSYYPLPPSDHSIYNNVIS
jgi:hypothetical protein